MASVLMSQVGMSASRARNVAGRLFTATRTPRVLAGRADPLVVTSARSTGPDTEAPTNHACQVQGVAPAARQPLLTSADFWISFQMSCRVRVFAPGVVLFT